MFRYLILMVLAAVAVGPFATGQGWDPRTQSTEKLEMVQYGDATISVFKQLDPTITVFFENAYGWAVFPKVAKGAIGIGGARGRGVLYRGGVAERKAYLRQFTVGLALGGKTYSEIIFFRDKAAFDRFNAGEFSFSAQATAILMSDGAGATNDYADDVAVFTRERTGAMFEASIGGQNFRTTELK